MKNMHSTADVLAHWATPMPEMGPAVYRLTEGPLEHKHHYHIVCPWSNDGQLLLMLRYEHGRAGGDICVQDMNDGSLRVVTQTNYWASHGAANQLWQGSRDRIVFQSQNAGRITTTTTVNPDGSDARTYELSDMDFCLTCSPDGRYGYGHTPLHKVLPDDEIAPRHDIGVMRLDFETGKTDLVFSLEDALSLFPDPDAIAHCHMHTKMAIAHRRTGRLLFNVVNAIWDAALDEPRVRGLVAVNADGTDPAYLGKPLNHPDWHPIDNRVLCNVKDFNGIKRFGLYNGDGSGLLEYVPNLRGAGHPTFSPDGKWIFTDGRSHPDGRPYVVLCDPRGDREIIAAEFDAYSEPYASHKAVDERADDESVIAALQRVAQNRNEQTRKTDGHPSWSRDGSVVVFNADLGDGSQLYAVDIARTAEAL